MFIWLIYNLGFAFLCNNEAEQEISGSGWEARVVGQEVAATTKKRKQHIINRGPS